jgi:hypothetical protein
VTVAEVVADKHPEREILGEVVPRGHDVTECGRDPEDEDADTDEDDDGGDVTPSESKASKVHLPAVRPVDVLAHVLLSHPGAGLRPA